MSKVSIVLSVLMLSSLACMQNTAPSSPAPSTPTKAPTETALTVASLAPKATPKESARSCKVTAQEALNLRAGAGVTFGVIGWLSPGERLTLTNTPARGNWIEVITETKLTGWINSKYCNLLQR